MSPPIRTAKSWQVLLQAAKNGDADAQLEVAGHYSSGINIKGVEIIRPDTKQTFKWIKAAYKNGNLFAAEQYAYYLSNGIHCKKDTALAVKLYEEAMNAGSPSAAYDLGTEYRDLHNFERAFTLYKRSGENLSVAMCYYHGIGTPQNRPKAFKLFKRLLKGDIVLSGYDTNEVNYMLGKMYLEGEVVTSSLTKARQYLLKANEDEDHPSARQILWIIGLK